jgi:hypothetical protein
MDEVGEGAGRIAFDEGEGPSMRFADLVVNPS